MGLQGGGSAGEEEKLPEAAATMAQAPAPGRKAGAASTGTGMGAAAPATSSGGGRGGGESKQEHRAAAKATTTTEAEEPRGPNPLKPVLSRAITSEKGMAALEAELAKPENAQWVNYIDQEGHTLLSHGTCRPDGLPLPALSSRRLAPLVAIAPPPARSTSNPSFPQQHNNTHTQPSPTRTTRARRSAWRGRRSC